MRAGKGDRPTVEEIHGWVRIADIRSYTFTETVKSFFETLLEDHSIQSSREKDLLVLGRIGIVHTT